MSKRRYASLRQNLVALRRLRDAEDGVTAIEYGLIASSIALAFVAIAILLGEDVGGMFTSLAEAVQDATDSGGD
ncbi:MAG: Flp family type IVb pilin [Alphaproteobacteria bacterium]